MATRDFYVTRDQKHPLYPTRMLTAGQAIPLSDSGARLYRNLGVSLSDSAPVKADEDKPLDKMTKAELVSLANVPEADAKRFTKAQLIAKIESK